MDRLRQQRIPSSGPVDRFYFRSLYTRGPNGILYEIATDGPGFASDEPLEALGERLSLPPFLGHTWYPHRFVEPAEVNEPNLGSALSALGDVVNRVAAAGVPPRHMALVGFSQGACLALEFARRRAQRLGAVIGLSGGLIGNRITPRAASS